MFHHINDGKNDDQLRNEKTRLEAVSMTLDLLGSFKEKGATIASFSGTFFKN